MHACEARDLPDPFAKPCREPGLRFFRDAFDYGHWTCTDHDGYVRAYYSQPPTFAELFGS